MTDPHSPDESAERLPAKGAAAAPDEILDPAQAGPGGFDFGSLLEAAGAMQQQLAEAQEEAADTQVDGVAGGGAVRIVADGAGNFSSVTIDPAAVDPDDVELLQDLILAALHDVTRRVAELQQQSLGDLGDLLGGGLGDLFGGGTA